MSDRVSSGVRRIRRLEPAAITGVMSREVANFRTFWKATTFSSLLEPTIYLLAFGLGLGSTIVANGVDGLSYVEFVGTGMVATAVIFSSALPAMFGTFVKHRFQRTYDAILAAPVDVEELVTAEVLWISLRSSASTAASRSWSRSRSASTRRSGMLLVPFFAFITAIGFGSFGIAVAGTVGKIDQFNYVTTLVITPLFLVAGTFFPINQLPEAFQVAGPVQPALPAGRARPRCCVRLRGGRRAAGAGAARVRVRDVAAGDPPDDPATDRLRARSRRAPAPAPGARRAASAATTPRPRRPARTRPRAGTPPRSRRAPRRRRRSGCRCRRRDRRRP